MSEKLDRMKQWSIHTLVKWCVDHQPGVTSAKLFDYSKEWYGKLWELVHTSEFERALESLREQGYRCTNKQWYPQGHKDIPKPRGPSKVDPRQTRMFG